MEKAIDGEMRESDRRILETGVVFHMNADFFMANSLDISGTGLRIRTSGPIGFRIQIEHGGELCEYLAELVWAKRQEDGSMEYGLKYSGREIL